MYIKIVCPDCGLIKYANILVDVVEGRTCPRIVDSWASTIISEPEFIEKIIHNISYYENLDGIKEVLLHGFNVAPCNVTELSEKVFKQIAGPQSLEVPMI